MTQQHLEIDPGRCRMIIDQLVHFLGNNRGEHTSNETDLVAKCSRQVWQ